MLSYDYDVLYLYRKQNGNQTGKDLCTKWSNKKRLKKQN